MARNQAKRRKPWVEKDGLLVPSHIDETEPIDAGSYRGKETLEQLKAELEKDERVQKQVLRADYEGPARHQILREVSLKIRTDAVAWAIPFDEIVFSKWMINFLSLRMMPWDDIITSLSTYLPDARNICHSNFVENSHCQWMIMLDSDVLPPPDFLGRLLDHDKKMVGGWYRMKADPYQPVVYDFEKVSEKGINQYLQRTQPGEGLESVDAAGAGIWLMHRDVAEAVGKKPYDMVKGGEDLLLCEKAHDAGFETWIDWDIACAHCGVAYV